MPLLDILAVGCVSGGLPDAGVEKGALLFDLIGRKSL